MTRVEQAPEAVLSLPATSNASMAAMSNSELGARLDDLFRLRAALDGHIVQLVGEAERRQTYRDDGATSAPAWVAERFELSMSGARALVRVAQKAWDIPQLVAALQEGGISFDKLRAIADVATPESEAALLEETRARSVRELAALARSRRTGPPPDPAAQHERRSLRCNDAVRTMTVQLPPESFAEAKRRLESIAKEIPSGDGETTWDQRMADAFMGLIRGGRGGPDGRGGPGGAEASPYFVVLHVPAAALLDESGEPSELAGDLERGGLLNVETVRRVVCDATISLAVDDDLGHTMYEGRARRDPTGPQHREVRRRDRHCRFPGCANEVFTNVHHIKEWKPDRGPTNLDNLALLCVHHHGLVHSKQWTMSGNANDVLTFVGPSGRIMSSRPSPLWTAVTGPAASRAAADRRL
ncbi:MAG TPA: DUF222 domain-containing protein [Acidimicrobiales bacterium]|jgi:hypothetical protein|nr:DUF222 domain-containing protein [Acidimicrobiales bacterium]